MEHRERPTKQGKLGWGTQFQVRPRSSFAITARPRNHTADVGENVQRLYNRESLNIEMSWRTDRPGRLTFGL